MNDNDYSSDGCNYEKGTIVSKKSDAENLSDDDNN